MRCPDYDPDRIAGIVRDGDLVLVKGSRGMRTETVVEALRARGKE